MLTRDQFSADRREKRWAVFRRPYVIDSGTLVFPGGGHSLEIQPAGEFNGIPVTGDPWILEEEVASFELAKERAVALSELLGLSRVRIMRVVDLHTVLYPIS